MPVMSIYLRIYHTTIDQYSPAGCEKHSFTGVNQQDSDKKVPKNSLGGSANLISPFGNYHIICGNSRNLAVQLHFAQHNVDNNGY